MWYVSSNNLLSTLRSESSGEDLGFQYRESASENRMVELRQLAGNPFVLQTGNAVLSA